MTTTIALERTSPDWRDRFRLASDTWDGRDPPLSKSARHAGLSDNRQLCIDDRPEAVPNSSAEALL